MPDSTHSPTDAPAPEGEREVLMVPADRVLASATSMHDLAALPAEQVPIVVVLRAARLLYDDAAIVVDAAKQRRPPLRLHLGSDPRRTSVACLKLFYGGLWRGCRRLFWSR